MNVGLSAIYSLPLWQSMRIPPVGDLTNQLNSYSQTISALGGYDNASIGLGVTIPEIDDWLENGLGRHVEVYGDSLNCFEGFVNSMSISLGPLSITRGPLLNVANRAWGHYSEYETGTDGVTATSQDASSQARYGIRPRILNIGQVSAATAAKVVATFLEENRWPETSTTYSQGENLALTLDIQGYFHLLDIPYINVGTGTYTLREKLIEVLNYEPNGLFNTDMAGLEPNGLSVFRAEKDKKCWDAIKDMVNMGSESSNSRMLFGIYAGRKAIYETIPTTIEYNRQIFSNTKIQSADGEVEPYLVRPGKWLEFSDFGAGLTTPDRRNNPRYMFIEAVTYTAPYDLSLTGGKVENLPQQLAKLGLQGI